MTDKNTKKATISRNNIKLLKAMRDEIGVCWISQFYNKGKTSQFQIIVDQTDYDQYLQDNKLTDTDDNKTDWFEIQCNAMLAVKARNMC